MNCRTRGGYGLTHMTKAVALLLAIHRRQGKQAKEYVRTLGPKCLPRGGGKRNLETVNAAMNLSTASQRWRTTV